MKGNYDMPKLSTKRDQTIKVVVEEKTLSLSNLDKVYFPFKNGWKRSEI